MFPQHNTNQQQQQQQTTFVQQQPAAQMFTTTPSHPHQYPSHAHDGILGAHPQHPQHAYAPQQQHPHQQQPTSMFAPPPQVQYVTLPHDAASQQQQQQQMASASSTFTPHFATMAVPDHRSQFVHTPVQNFVSAHPGAPPAGGAAFITQSPQGMPMNMNYGSTQPPQHMQPVYIMSGQPQPTSGTHFSTTEQRVSTPSLHSPPSGGVQYVFLPNHAASPQHQSMSIIPAPSPHQHSSPPTAELHSMHIASPQPQAMWQPSNAFVGMANAQPNQQLNMPAASHYGGAMTTAGAPLMLVSQPPMQMQQQSFLQQQQQQPSMMTFSQYQIPTHHPSPSVPIGRGSVSSMSLEWNVTPRYSIDSSMHLQQGAPMAMAARKHSGGAPILGAHPMPSTNGPAGSSSSAKVGIVCRHFIEGKCNRRKCRFVHDATGVMAGDATVSHVDENDVEGDDDDHPANDVADGAHHRLPVSHDDLLQDNEHTVHIGSISEH